MSSDDPGDNDLERWLRQLTTALGTEVDIPQERLLDLARIAAHGIARPAAPLTTFVAGYVAGRRGGSAGDVDDVITATLAALDRAQ